MIPGPDLSLLQGHGVKKQVAAMFSCFVSICRISGLFLKAQKEITGKTYGTSSLTFQISDLTSRVLQICSSHCAHLQLSLFNYTPISLDFCCWWCNCPWSFYLYTYLLNLLHYNLNSLSTQYLDLPFLLEKCFRLKFLAGKVLPYATDLPINFLLCRFILKSGVNAESDQMVILKQLWTFL